MSRQQDQPREVLGHRHRPQHRLGHGDALPVVEAGDPTAHRARFEPRSDAADHTLVEAIGIGVADRPRQARAVADELGGEQQPHRLDIGERRHGGELERLPRLRRAAAQQAEVHDLRLLGFRRVGDCLAHHEGGLQQHRALRPTGLAADRHIFDREAEEASEPDRLGVGADGLERASIDFGANVDAECRLERLTRGGGL